ncbi:MAG: flagellar basal body P-ring formation protein FlgA [Alphaproteobacteria bacterium]|nr:flagellar basal body P-ring formation protein FlgA [Alphaproteobacteria bacterium]
MIRTLRLLALALPVALAPLSASVADLGKPVLKLKAQVSGDMVRLGDLFENIAAEKAEIRVDQAPAPGNSLTYQPSQLAAFARMHGLDWKPQTYMDKVVLERQGQLVSKATVDAALRKALAAKGVTGELEFEIASRAYQLYVSEVQAPTVAVELNHYDPDSRSFIAEFRAPADEPRADRVRVAGRAHTMIDVPVFTRRMMPNEIVRASDLSWVKMRSGPMLANNVTLLEDIIGKTPKRPIQAGQPIRQADVGAFTLVQRNESVTMILRTRSMTLTVQGKALEDGGEGQTIRVQNPKSNRTVEGRVTGPGEVTVITGPLSAAASSLSRTVQR